MKLLGPDRSILLPVTLLACLVAATAAQRADELDQHQYEGTLGKSWIGMTVLRKGNDIEGGHYFYQRYLRDIPITGAFDGLQITLTEPDGGKFTLHFVGNGSEAGQPLDFENSVGMQGTWTSADGTRNYPISLTGSFIGAGQPNERRYRDVTDESDGAFESRVQAWFHAVLRGDRATALRYISYPLSANLPDGRRKKFPRAADVAAAWDELFTPALLAQLRQSLPHDMFVRNGLAMLGRGEGWFDAKGLTVLNVPPHQRP